MGVHYAFPALRAVIRVFVVVKTLCLLCTDDTLVVVAVVVVGVAYLQWW